MLKNTLRVWGVWDKVISRLEYLSESQSDCRNMIKLFQKSHRSGVELVRFDLSPLYYDNASASSYPAPSTRWSRLGGFSSSLHREGRNNTQKTTHRKIKE